MKNSIHTYTDKRGYLCDVEVIDQQGERVVFDSTPKLAFDLRAHRLGIRRNRFCDYSLVYRLKDGNLYLCALKTRPSVFSRNKPILGVSPKQLGDGRWVIYDFGDMPCDYSGKLAVGEDFDMRYMPADDKAEPVPFCPEVYKKNGYIIIEKGRITETFIE